MTATPLPIFDDLQHIKNCDLKTLVLKQEFLIDFEHAWRFLTAYKGSLGTFVSYRRDVERLLHWCVLVAQKKLGELKRQDMEEFIEFCQTPPQTWIGVHKVPRFIEKEGCRLQNPNWRPFVVTVTKAAYKRGERPNLKDFEFSNSAIKDMFAILGSFFNYLIQEEYVSLNPVALIRQKSKFIRKVDSMHKIRRLSDSQWNCVLQTARDMASMNPTKHERTLFMMSSLYLMYLRISELAASQRWCPAMNHFFKDQEDNWWFTTVGKGNKQRQIAVSDTMLEALRRWRTHLNLSSLPSLADKTPLFPKRKGLGPITNATYVREIVQECFDNAIKTLREKNLHDDADMLGDATVHWLRHTGISDDVKRRPREHVRDDAGHGSGAITDRYIDIDLKERHKSAKHKNLGL